MEKIIIIGYGGHSKSIVDTIEANGKYEIVGFVDKDKGEGTDYRHYKVIGTDSDYEKIYSEGIRHACMGIGYMGNGDIRPKLYKKLKDIGYILPSIIDPSAVIACDALINEGSFIGKNSIVNSGARIGRLAILNSGAVIEHECVIGDFTHVAVSAVVCGGTRIGKRCMVGANSTIIQGLTICDDVIIGGGAVVSKSIVLSGTYVGAPSKRLK